AGQPPSWQAAGPVLVNRRYPPAWPPSAPVLVRAIFSRAGAHAARPPGDAPVPGADEAADADGVLGADGVLAADGVLDADGALLAAGALPGAGTLPQAARVRPQATTTAAAPPAVRGAARPAEPCTAKNLIALPSGTPGLSVMTTD